MLEMTRAEQVLTEASRDGLIARLNVPRAHKVWLSKLSLLAWRLNSELDDGRRVPVADARKAIKEGRIIKFVRGLHPDKDYGFLRLDSLDSNDELTISEYFESTESGVCPEDMRVRKNGLCWLLALTIEMMDKQEWTTFDDPTKPPP